MIIHGQFTEICVQRNNSAIPILDNEAYIGTLLDNIEYGTINSRKALIGRIESVKRKQKQHNRGNARPSWEGGTDERVRGLDIRQSANGKRSDVGTEEDNLLFRDSEAEPFYSNAERGRRTDAQEVEVEGDSRRESASGHNSTQIRKWHRLSAISVGEGAR